MEEGGNGKGGMVKERLTQWLLRPGGWGESKQ
jgi:hypothetical protein